MQMQHATHLKGLYLDTLFQLAMATEAFTHSSIEHVHTRVLMCKRDTKAEMRQRVIVSWVAAPTSQKSWKTAMRFICFILPWMQRSGTPGRSRRSISYTYFTCLHVDRNTSTFACGARTHTHQHISSCQLFCARCII